MSRIALLLIACLSLSTMLINQRWKTIGIIMWDVSSYYSYLPAYFIQHDLSLDFIDKDPEAFKGYQHGVQPFQHPKVIKTSMGMAVMYAPFFAIGHVWALSSGGYHLTDGFSRPYQVCIALSGWFYAMLGGWFLRKILLRFYSEKVSAITLSMLFLGTNAWYYTTDEGAMPHIPGFCLIAIFVWLVLRWYDHPVWKNTLALGLLSGFIFLMRPTNALAGIVFLLYGVHNLETLQSQAVRLWQYRFHLLVMGVLAGLLFFPQMLYWKTYTGHWMYDSYPGERFFFDRPRIWQGLFSYTKGWFVYTPMMLFAIAGMIRLPKKIPALGFGVIGFWAISAYVLLSWWSWWYGGSFGHRAFIDGYALLAFPMAASVDWVLNQGKLWIKGLFWVLVLLFTGLNQFQTWQYRHAIIHWDGMSKDAYWAIFLKTESPPGFTALLHQPNYEKAKLGIEDYWK